MEASPSSWVAGAGVEVYCWGACSSPQTRQQSAKKESASTATAMATAPAVERTTMTTTTTTLPRRSSAHMHKVRTMRQLSVTKTKASSSIAIAEHEQQKQHQQQQSDSVTSMSRIRKVAGLEGKRVVQASVGGSHVALLTDDGEVFCYGEGDSGQLGLGATARRVDRPTRVTAALDSVSVVHVACGAHHTAAVTSSGSLVTWYDTERHLHERTITSIVNSMFS